MEKKENKAGRRGEKMGQGNEGNRRGFTLGQVQLAPKGPQT